MPKCPGQNQRFWKPDDIFEINCPDCGTPIEFWKDEPTVKCSNCKKPVVNPKFDIGCLQWCKYAKECLGTLAGHNSDILCNILIKEMEKVFGDDLERINHSLEVLKYAEQIQLAEGGDPLVVKAAAILHDIGTHETQGECGSTTKESQQTEGAITAGEILTGRGVKTELIEHICQIIDGRYSAKHIDTIEFKIVWDADWLARFEKQFPNATRVEIKELIESTFKTKKGRQIATERFI